jgi:hypothetical protein
MSTAFFIVAANYPNDTGARMIGNHRLESRWLVSFLNERYPDLQLEGPDGDYTGQLGTDANGSITYPSLSLSMHRALFHFLHSFILSAEFLELEKSEQWAIQEFTRMLMLVSEIQEPLVQIQASVTITLSWA